MKKIITLFLTLSLLCLCFGCSADKSEEIKLTEVFDHVFDAGTIKTLDYDYADAYFNKEYNNWGGGCSAIAKTLDNGDTIIGRNMDLNISNKAAYIFRTDVKDCYKTINLTYTFRDISPDFEDAKANGLSEEFSKVLPFMADDVLNEKGLYIEVNMRNGEFWPTGESKFSCKGTNPSAERSVYMFELPRYIGEHCATVDEALDYVNTLNVYSKEGYWNYCFLIADATGHYGVLEFACDAVIWNDYHPCQTNFYINELVNYVEELQCGKGRYENLMKGISNVKNEEDMFNLIDSVTYYQVYDPYNCNFDPRSENVGVLPFATNEVLDTEEYKEYIIAAIDEIGQGVRSMSRQEQQNKNEYWESSFTEVINCNKKTLTVRFFEDDEKIITLSFDK